MNETRKPKKQKLDWPYEDSKKPHVRNWFRSLSSKRLKGEARAKKMDALMDQLR
jgi:hypothetical protein